jgi:plasmid maintenance system antidote protein VapI
MSRRPPRLITELLALTASWGWTVADLAREIHVDPTTILHYRSGRRALTTATLSKIAVRFGEHRMVRDLVWHHLTAESQENEDAGDGASAPKGLPAAIEHALRAYASRFAEESVHAGRGLFIFAETAAPLSAATQFAKALFTAAKIPVCALRADKTPPAAESRFALAAPLLIVERVDFACPAIAELLRRRSDLTRPTVVSSMKAPDATDDAYLRRIYVATMRRIEAQPVIAPTSEPSHASHAA